MSNLTQSPAWLALAQHRANLGATPLADLVLNDPERLTNYALKTGGLKLDYALQYVTAETIDLLIALAEQQGLSAMREKMWRGDAINISENRAALHVALRQDKQHRPDKPVEVDGRAIAPEIDQAYARMAAFVENVRQGRWRGATGKPIRHIVNIGIGGSDLGPRMVVQALERFTSGPRVHFVANADAFDLLGALKPLDPAETLFVVASKSFTTQETLLNADSARRWIVETLGEAAVPQHFVAVSASRARVEAFGIAAANIFPIWDWVGGRFSLWSAIGLGIALAVGMDCFDRLLQGAAAMDAHFRAAPLRQNMPAMLALLGVWNRNFLPSGALAVLPYTERLRELPRYLQQLDMESNGKSVTRDGAPIAYATAPVIFGECGTVGQHSFHQWLHQGREIVPVDFIGIVADDLNMPAHHRALWTNMVAQAGALAFGQSQHVTPFAWHQGGRPSNLIALDRLDPFHLGQLVTLYEHKIFCQGVIWNINSFDQPGVELGKTIARGFDKADFATPSGAFGPVGAFLGRLLQSLI